MAVDRPQGEVPALVKYHRGEPDEWRTGVEKLDVRQVKANDGSTIWEIFGPCPRCGHELHRDISYILGPALARPSSEQPESLVVRVVCNCTHYHDGAPDNDRHPET